MSGKKPVKVFRAGGVAAAIWENTVKQNGKEVVMPSVQIDRTYKQGDEYKRTSNFNERDLPKVQLVVSKAFEFLSMKSQENGNGFEEKE